MAGVEGPTDHPLVKTVCKAAQRILPAVLHRKQPLTVDHLRRLVGRTADDCSLPQLMIITAILVGFFGFFRFSDLANIWVDWISLYDTHVEIFLQSRKNDQFREGHWLAIAANSGSRICPVRWLRLLLSRAALVGHRPLFSFCTAKGHYGRSQIGYSALRDLLLRQLEEIGLPRSSSGTHSLHAGGATMAANIAVELGIPDRLWHEHGGWRSV